MAKALEGNKSLRVLFLLIFFWMQCPTLVSHAFQALDITYVIPTLAIRSNCVIQFQNIWLLAHNAILNFLNRASQISNHTYEILSVNPSIYLLITATKILLHPLLAYLTIWCITQAWFTLNYLDRNFICMEILLEMKGSVLWWQDYLHIKVSWLCTTVLVTEY